MADNKFTKFMQKAWAVIKRTAKRVWEYLKVAKMEWIVMIALFALDLITKSIVVNTVNPYNPVVLIPNFLQINYTTNIGAAYGSDFMVDLLTPTGSRIFFSAFAVAASVAFILILIRNKGKNKLFRIGIAMFVAGAMGNCMDRMFLGYVRDFVHFSFQPYIFNIADAELIFGVVLIVIYLLFFFHDSDKKASTAVPEPTGETPEQSASINVRSDAAEALNGAEPEAIENTVDDNLHDGTDDIPPTPDTDEGSAADDEQVNIDTENAQAEDRS